MVKSQLGSLSNYSSSTGCNAFPSKILPLLWYFQDLGFLFIYVDNIHVHRHRHGSVWSTVITDVPLWMLPKPIQEPSKSQWTSLKRSCSRLWQYMLLCYGIRLSPLEAEKSIRNSQKYPEGTFVSLTSWMINVQTSLTLGWTKLPFFFQYAKKKKKNQANSQL
jgi:hypothetical protein